jgi:hypothetical protein
MVDNNIMVVTATQTVTFVPVNMLVAKAETHISAYYVVGL